VLLPLVFLALASRRTLSSIPPNRPLLLPRRNSMDSKGGGGGLRCTWWGRGDGGLGGGGPSGLLGGSKPDPIFSIPGLRSEPLNKLCAGSASSASGRQRLRTQHLVWKTKPDSSYVEASQKLLQPPRSGAPLCWSLVGRQGWGGPQLTWGGGSPLRLSDTRFNAGARRMAGPCWPSKNQTWPPLLRAPGAAAGVHRQL